MGSINTTDLGNWQLEVLADAIEASPLPIDPLSKLKGKAKHWRGRYWRNLQSLVNQIDELHLLGQKVVWRPRCD